MDNRTARSKPKWTLLIISLIIAPLLIIACHSKEDEHDTPVVVTVKTAKAELGTLQLAVQAPATIFPRQKAEIAARITAPVRILMAGKGDEVHANQLLAILGDTELGNYVLTWDYLQHQRSQLMASLAKEEANVARIQNGTEPISGERAVSLERSRNLAHSIRAQQIPDNDAQLRLLEVRSPFNGSITEQYQFRGDMAKPESPMFTVTDLSLVTARAQVSETDVGRIRKGLSCQFNSVEAGAEPPIGRVTMINQAVDTQRRAVEVWCEISNLRYKLRAGTFGEVRFVVGKSAGVMVPETAVQRLIGAAKGSVIVIDATHHTHRREVQIGEIQDRKVQILKGLNAGEVVVTEGGYGLPDNITVTLAENE